MRKYSLDQYPDYKKQSEAYNSIRSRRRVAEKTCDELTRSLKSLEDDFVKALEETAKGTDNVIHETQLKDDFNLKKIEIQTNSMELIQIAKAEAITKLKFDQACELTYQSIIEDALKDFRPIFKKIIENLKENNRLHRQVRDIYSELAASGIPGRFLAGVEILMLCTARLDPGGENEQNAILPALINWAKEKGIYE